MPQVRQADAPAPGEEGKVVPDPAGPGVGGAEVFPLPVPRQGRLPLDRALGLEGRAVTPGMADILARTAPGHGARRGGHGVRPGGGGWGQATGTTCMPFGRRDRDPDAGGGGGGRRRKAGGRERGDPRGGWPSCTPPRGVTGRPALPAGTGAAGRSAA